MNRQLQHTAKALSASAAVFTLLLLAGGPVRAPSTDMSSLASVESIDLVQTPIADDTSTSASQRRHRRHSRALLALPYFSFAQGLRRNRS